MTITLLLLIITGITSFMAFNNRAIMEKMILNPYIIKREKEYFRFLSSGFIHANWMHLLFNGFVLYSFGEIVEINFSTEIMFGSYAKYAFLGLYFGGLLASDIPTYLKHQDNGYYRSLGASGAVSSVVFAFIMMEPFAPLTIIFFPFYEFSAVVLGGLYLLYSAYAAKTASDGINHDAHLYGALFGIVYVIALRPHVIGMFLETIMQSSQ